MHIPNALRERLCALDADCLEGTLADEAVWATLAEAQAKLLLYAIPARMAPVVELEQRIALWEAQDFEALLFRV